MRSLTVTGVQTCALPISSLERFSDMGVAQLRAWHGAGGRVLFGTDVGYMDDYDPTGEYVLKRIAGMSFSQILASLTTTPARPEYCRVRNSLDRRLRSVWR